MLPAVPAELRLYAEEVSIALEGHRSLSAVELNAERTGISIHWYGDATELTDLLSRAPDGFSVTVEATVNEPGTMRDEVLRLLNSGQATSAGIDVNASKIMLTPATSSGSRRAPVSSIYPIEEESLTPPEPASRNSDSLGIGGARISLGGSTCSTAFGVKKGTATAMITAAHCGSTGLSVKQGTARYGTTGARNITHDAMLITGKSGGYQGGFYQNDKYDDPNEDSYQMPVFGSLNPIIGDEICYSGALRGLTCGHIVTDAGYTWSFSGMSNIQGFRTKQQNNYLYVGKGDSGGPGIVLVIGEYDVQPYAATIISGMQGGVVGYCDTGLQSDNNECSKTILTTGIRGAAQAFGYSVILL